MSKTYVTMHTDDMAEEINGCYDSLISVLLEDGVITEEKAEEIGCYRTIVVEKNIFGKLFEKVFNKKSGTSWTYIIQKLRG